MKLNELRPAKGSMKKRFKKGRGPASGLGKTAGRGQKGAGARKSAGDFIGFEGGQNPLQRRVPKRGFNSHFPDVQEVNLGDLEKNFTTGVVDAEAMKSKRLIHHTDKLVKILGQGALTKALTVKANRFSASAKAAIEAAGGKAEVI
jgi:large subunit ribosomal protein L15